jgi:hypothetical protein
MQPNPYCSFKSDVERRKALLARDIRLVLMAAIAERLVPWERLIAWFSG